LEKLFKQNFDFKSFNSSAGKKLKFKCPNENKCKIKKRIEPIYTGAPTINNTNIMAIKEAPSASEGGVQKYLNM